VKTAQQQKIEEYRKNSEVQLEKLRKQTQATADTLHQKARKLAKQEKEISSHEQQIKSS
jgi:hypothetical protein